jgi:hypothetical protein
LVSFFGFYLKRFINACSLIRSQEARIQEVKIQDTRSQDIRS